jgi:hypothetical protein
VDQGEPPRIVIEEPAACSDQARADEILRRTMLPARAPVAGWTLSLRASKDKAEGEITDESGSPVAHRAFARANGDCAGLARAVGVWANLVLDEEMKRPRPAKPPVVKAASAEAPPPWPAPAVNEKPSPEQFTLLKHEADKRSMEAGVATFFMGGLGTKGFAGVQAFMTVEMSGAVFVRPSLALGRTFSSVIQDVYGTWGAARFDTCVRLPGMYRERVGLQLDGCLGADIGFTIFDRESGAQGPATSRTLPFFSMGPLLSLRGELSGPLSAELRGVGGLNVIRETLEGIEPGLFVWRTEIGLSWRLR